MFSNNNERQNQYNFKVKNLLRKNLLVDLYKRPVLVPATIVFNSSSQPRVFSNIIPKIL